MKVSSVNDLHSWRFVTNHANVLVCIAADPTARVRDIAEVVGITERSVAQILVDLEEAGYVTKTRGQDARRNRYEVHGELPLRHSRHRHRTVDELIRFLRERPTRK